MAGEAKFEIHDAAATQLRRLIGKIDFDIVMFKELAIEREDGFIDSLFGDEEKPAAVRIGGK